MFVHLDPVTWAIVGVLITLDMAAIGFSVQNARKVGMAASESRRAADNAEEAAATVAELVTEE